MVEHLVFCFENLHRGIRFLKNWEVIIQFLASLSNNARITFLLLPLPTHLSLLLLLISRLLLHFIFNSSQLLEILLEFFKKLVITAELFEVRDLP
jgi:hypothetical protein